MTSEKLNLCMCGGTPKQDGEAGFTWVTCRSCEKTIHGIFNPDAEDCIGAVWEDARARWNDANNKGQNK